LEKAKTDLYLNGEYLRHQRELDALKVERDDGFRNLKAKAEDKERKMEKDHNKKMEMVND
jgi:hypothetical protein